MGLYFKSDGSKKRCPYKNVERKYSRVDLSSYEFFVKIKTAVDKNFPLKTIKQIKDKLRNLEGSYEKAKENNQKQEFH